MKTIIDAVKEFEGEFPLGFNVLANFPSEDDGCFGMTIGAGYDPRNECCGCFIVCNKEEFNAEVGSMSRHAGGELYERYVRVAKTPLEKSSVQSLIGNNETIREFASKDKYKEKQMGYTPEELLQILDKATGEIFERRQLAINIYCWIKKLEYIPESHFIDNAEQFDKIETLIDEIKNEK